MARYLAYTSPARGHLYPLVETLDALRGRGHDVAVRTLASEVEAMRARGFDAVQLQFVGSQVGRQRPAAARPSGLECRGGDHRTLLRDCDANRRNTYRT